MSETETGTESQYELSSGNTYNVTALKKTFGAVGLYDDSNFHTSKSEEHLAEVMPRAFLTEYGYNIDGEQIPRYFGDHLVKERLTTDEETAVFVKGDTPGNTYSEPEEKLKMLRRDAYTQIEIYRFDGEPDDEEEGLPINSKYADGGYLIRYAIASHQDPPVADVHPHIGYYITNDSGIHNLITVLFNKNRESDRFNSWNNSDNYPDEQWNAVYVNENTLLSGGSNGGILCENALYRDDDGDAEWVGPLDRPCHPY